MDIMMTMMAITMGTPTITMRGEEAMMTTNMAIVSMMTTDMAIVSMMSMGMATVTMVMSISGKGGKVTTATRMLTHMVT